MARIKLIPIESFEHVFERDGEPVKLVGDALPGFTRRIPASWFIASGQYSAQSRYSSNQIPDGRLVGGIDVYRDSPDDPVLFNKDWYPIVAPGDSPADLLTDGPLWDSEHWTDEIPARYDGIEVIGSPTKARD